MQRRRRPGTTLHVLSAGNRIAKLVQLVKVEVSTGAEVVPGTPEHHNPLLGAGEIVTGRCYLIPAPRRYRVLSLRLVQRQPPDGTMIRNQDVIIHRLENTDQLRCGAVGLNPFRQQDKTKTDVLIVVTFIVITILVVLWAWLGG